MDLSELEQWRESNRLEVKAAQGGLPRDVWSSVSAFANTDGGLIVLGVKENMNTRELRVFGVPNAQKMLEDFINAANSADKLSYPILTDEHLRIEDIGGREVIVIEVPRVDRHHRPVYVGRDPFVGTYRRKFTGDYLCKREEVTAMLRDASVESLDLKVSEHSGIEDLNYETVRAYRSLYNESHRDGIVRNMDDGDFLCQIGAAKRERDGSISLTCAGLLMFGQEWRIVYDFPNFFLDYRQEMGGNRRWEDRFTSQELEWSGNVFDFYERAYTKLKRALKVPFQLDGIRRVDETSAHEALREAIVNALTNADYHSSRAVVFRWTDEGIELKNPGSFRVGVEQAYQGGTSDARNKTMLKMFTLIQVGERAGSGVPNMVDQWMSRGYNRPVLTEELDPEVSTVFLPLEAEEIETSNGSGGESGFSENERTAIALAQENGRVTTRKLAETAGISKQTASALLKRLEARGTLRWHGNNKHDPSQYYLLA